LNNWITPPNVNRSALFSFFVVGFILISFSILLMVILLSILKTKHTLRIQKIIAQESKKYSSRSPIPCSWRLGTTADYSLISGNRNSNKLANYVSITQSSFVLFLYFK
jgi:hypothetical protein